MRPIDDDDDDDDDDELGIDAKVCIFVHSFLPPTLLTACPAPPRIGSGRVLRLSSRSAHCVGRLQRRQLIRCLQVSFLLRRRRRRRRPSSVRVSVSTVSMAADLSRPPIIIIIVGIIIVLFLSRSWKKAFRFSARRSDERGIWRSTRRVANDVISRDTHRTPRDLSRIQ